MCFQGQSGHDPLKISREGGVCKNSLGGIKIYALSRTPSRFKVNFTVNSVLVRKEATKSSSPSFESSFELLEFLLDEFFVTKFTSSFAHN